MATSKLMLILGATGFLGSFVVKQMLAEGYAIRVLTRGADDWKDSSVVDLRHKGVDVVIGEVTDSDALSGALDQVAAVVNMVGCFSEKKGASFDELHVGLLENLIELGTAKGVKRLIHVSCLGASEDSEGPYYQSKWEGEELIRESKLYWTIFRPSFMFGERFPLFAYLKPLLTFRLFLPIIGSGTNTLAPVYVNDVASCVSQCIYQRQTVGQSYDLVGPEEYSMLELLEMARKHLGLKGPTMNIPSKFTGSTFDMVSKAIPRALLTKDLASFMSEDSCAPQDVMLRHFEVRNVSLEQCFGKIMESL